MPKREPIINLDVVRGPILTVWNAIGYDMEQACRDGGERMTNISMIEACIDADRITFFMSKKDPRALAAEAEIDRAIKTHGYDRVLRALARGIHLT